MHTVFENRNGEQFLYKKVSDILGLGYCFLVCCPPLHPFLLVFGGFFGWGVPPMYDTLCVFAGLCFSCVG